MTDRSEGPGIPTEALEGYLARVLGGTVRVRACRPLGDDGAAVDPKGVGYGAPFEVECEVGGEVRALVVARTRPAHGFGHDYPADRAWQAMYAHGAYNTFPRHARSLDVGFLRRGGELVSAGDALEYFQIVEKVDGSLYWRDLDRLMKAPAQSLDYERAGSLGAFLASSHAVKLDESTLYERRIRELVGHGECLMGILDSYPHPYPLLSAGDCEALEHAAVRWRWKLRGNAGRLSRVHGDFHPWNILFQEGTDFSVLDRSRGEWGEPADDVAALGINYLFFGVRKSEGREVAEPFRSLFDRFMDTYVAGSGDAEIIRVLPPFFMFRALVLAHPRWYPTLPEPTRRALLDFAHAMAEASEFDLEASTGALRAER